MKSSQPIALIGGYDPIAKSFFSRTMMLNNGSIFINVNDNPETAGAFAWLVLK